MKYFGKPKYLSSYYLDDKCFNKPFFVQKKPIIMHK